VPSIPTITAPTWSATAHRAAEPLRIGAFALAIAAVELILAKGIAGPEISRYVFLFIGLMAVAFVFRFPMATALLFFGLTDFVFYPTYFAHNVGALSVRPHELALACLLAFAVIRPRKQTWGGAPGTALAIFLALVSFSGLLAVQAGDTTFSDAFNWARPLGLLTFFYVVVRLFPSPRDRRLLLIGVGVLAALAGVVAALVAMGAGLGTVLQGGGEIVRSQEGDSLERVRLAGLSAGYAIFWLSVVQAVRGSGNGRVGWALIAAGILLDVAVSFNRNMWLGLAIGAILMAVFGGTMIRNRMAVGAAVAAAGVALLLAFGSSGTNNTVVQPIVKRGETLFSPSKTSKENSLQDRAKETQAAWDTAQANLLLGVGPGVPFGVFASQALTSGNLFFGINTVPQLYLHNQYLYLVLIAGLPGLIAFLLFLGLPIAYAIRRQPSDPAIVACGVGVALVMLSAVVAIYFTVEDMTAVLGLLTGIVVADHQGRGAAGEDAGLTS
jgi:O-antigen ligase